MSVGIITLLMFLFVFLLLFLGLPVAFTLGGVALAFSLALWGHGATFMILGQTMGAMNHFLLIAIPLFIFMALLLEGSGVADDLYTMMHYWMGPLRGGLAVGTVFICTIFAAMSGISGTGVVTMGIIALPQMLKRGYNKNMAMGCIMAGGALGPLIPPSVIMIIYGLYAEIPVAKMFMAGLFPGLLFSSLFVAYILIRCFFNPSDGPALAPEERISWKSKLVALRALVLPGILVISVLGTIFMGLATPTEAASVGALGAMITAAIHHKLSLPMVRKAALNTLATTCMVMWIIIGATCFASVYHGLGASKLVEQLLITAPLNKWGILAMMQLSYFVLGCFVDALSILFITAPVFIPVATLLGFNPVWFGILYVLNTEMGYLTPPFGMNLFYLKGVAPPEITMGNIYGSVWPFVMLQATGLFLVILFPPIALWLPGVLFK